MTGDEPADRHDEDGNDDDDQRPVIEAGKGREAETTATAEDASSPSEQAELLLYLAFDGDGTTGFSSTGAETKPAVLLSPAASSSAWSGLRTSSDPDRRQHRAPSTPETAAKHREQSPRQSEIVAQDDRRGRQSRFCRR